jgi:hypothetical protein
MIEGGGMDGERVRKIEIEIQRDSIKSNNINSPDPDKHIK